MPRPMLVAVILLLAWTPPAATALEMKGWRRLSGLDKNATLGVFDVEAEMAAEGIEHVPGKSRWAEMCSVKCIDACMGRMEHLPTRDPWLKLLGWDKAEDCRYRCTQVCIHGDLLRGGRHWKVNGRWPHRRLLGLREPMSVLFSVANLAAHAAGLGLILKVPPSPAFHGRNRLAVMSCAWIVAWAGSAAFHGMPTWLTERLDYYSGNFAMGFMLYTGIVRAGWTRLSLSSSMARLGLLGAISAGLGAHMACGWGKIDYGLNMKVMITMVVAHSLSWLSVCLTEKMPHAKHFYASTIMLYAAGLLEVFDFPPLWGHFDAHSAWHAATPLTTILFYRFLQCDAISMSASPTSGS